MMDHIPTRAAVEAKLLDLIEGRCSRDEASAWAEQWIIHDFDEDIIDDLVLLEGLEVLSFADAPTTDRPYLYGEVDFRAWLDKLRQAA